MQEYFRKAIASGIHALRDKKAVTAEVVFSRCEDLIQYSSTMGDRYFPYQASAGRFYGSTVLVRWNGLYIFIEGSNQDIIFYDPPASATSPVICICQTETGAAINFPGKGMLVRRRANGLSVSITLIDEIILDDLPAGEVIGHAPEKELWRSAHQLVQDLSTNSSTLDSQLQFISLDAELLGAILSAFYWQIPSRARNEAINAVDVVQKYLDACNRLNTRRVNDLTLEMGMSRRNLQNYTNRILGLGPKKLAKCVGLRDVIRSLSHTRATGQGIGDLAFEHGFENFSQFCADYRHMFGERPTDTLARHVM